jgi:hypothetical protein
MLDGRSSRPAALILVALFALVNCGDGSGGGGTGSDKAVEVTSRAESGGGANESSQEFYLGKPRDDVDRYFGLYGEPGRGQFFVTEAKRPKYAEQAPEIPPGYLAIGAMWGDVAPMSMKSFSATKFQQVDLSDFAPDTPNVAEFELGPDGNAVALTFTSGAFSEFGRRVRVGQLPEEWR